MNVDSEVGFTAHVDTFARDRLPARSAWPDLLAAGLSYPDRLNAADELLAGGAAARRACTATGSCGATTRCASAPGGSRASSSRRWASRPATGCSCTGRTRPS